MQRFRDCGETWRIYGMTFPTLVLSSSSSFFVSLIVLLRLLAIRKPMGFENTHEKLSKIGSLIIWSFCLFVPSIVFVLTVPSIYDQRVYALAILIQCHVIYTVPIIATISMYVMLLRTLKKKTNSDMNEETRMRLTSMAKMTQGIVVGLIVCNVPLILWMQYWLVMLSQGNGDAVFESTFGVKIFAKY